MTYYIITLITILGLDLFTKYLVQSNIMLYQIIPLMPGWLNLTHIQNTGAAFGLMAQANGWWRYIFFYGISFAAIVAMTVMFLKYPETRRISRLGLIFVLAGAIGNQIDRVRLGAVVDFIDVYYKQWHWPAFNVADSAICVGVGLLLLDMRKEYKESEANRQNPPNM